MGKCRDTEHFTIIPDKFRFKAIIYDYSESAYEEPPTVYVEMIDYKTGHIWYNNGFRSTNFILIREGD